jgi:hypothetical protein
MCKPVHLIQKKKKKKIFFRKVVKFDFFFLPVEVLEKMAGKVEILKSRMSFERPTGESGEEGVGHQRGRKSPINLHSIAYIF